MPKSLQFLHQNRDENSFTARLFEYVLFPLFNNDPDSFRLFVNRLNEKSLENYNKIISKGNPTFVIPARIPDNLEFVDAMLFMECWDFYTNTPGFEGEIEDKTEFDCMIIGKIREDYHAIVFEVKCYSDLEYKELDRQQYHLNNLKSFGLFKTFHHLGLISKDNLDNWRKVFEEKGTGLEMSIVTWSDLKPYLVGSPRFSETDYLLPKRINKFGKPSGLRSLI